MRRQLNLPPLRLPVVSTPVQLGSGSRFSCLAGGDDSDDGGLPSVAEAVVWQGFADDPKVLPIERAPGMTREKVLADYWDKLGYPTPKSRPWEWPSSSSPEVSGEEAVTSDAI
jgi:hypothetical protein